MGARIIEQEDESLVIVVEQDVPTVIQAESVSKVIVSNPGESYVLPIVDGRVVVSSDVPISQIIESINGGSKPYYREIINYDGGHPDTLYGDLVSLKGGGVSDPFYYSL